MDSDVGRFSLARIKAEAPQSGRFLSRTRTKKTKKKEEEEKMEKEEEKEMEMEKKFRPLL